MGESGRSRVEAEGFPESTGGKLAGQFEVPYGASLPPTMFTIPVLRYLASHGLTPEDMAPVSVIQREWAASTARHPAIRITVDDVANARMVALSLYPAGCAVFEPDGGVRLSRRQQIEQKIFHICLSMFLERRARRPPCKSA